MPRYERIAADVNVDEEAELRRLEGLPPPSTSGAAMEDALTNVGVQMHTWTNGPPIALVRDPRSRIASASVENWPPVSGETPLSWYEYCSPLAGAYCRTVLVRHCDGTRTGTLYSYNL